MCLNLLGKDKNFHKLLSRCRCTERIIDRFNPSSFTSYNVYNAFPFLIFNVYFCCCACSDPYHFLTCGLLKIYFFSVFFFFPSTDCGIAVSPRNSITWSSPKFDLVLAKHRHLLMYAVCGADNFSGAVSTKLFRVLFVEANAITGLAWAFSYELSACVRDNSLAHV